jgi:hypothetical protein
MKNALDDGSVPCSIFFGKKEFSQRYGPEFFTVELTGILDGSQTNGATHYIICVKAGKHRWEVQRRYSDFKRLAGVVRPVASDRGAPLPPGTWCGPPREASALESRRASLEEWLVAALSDRSNCAHPDIRAFLAIDEQNWVGEAGQ